MVNKFERCVLKVKSKQSKSCKSKKWKGKGCVNPWAVCHASLDGTNTEQMIRGEWYQIRPICEIHRAHTYYGRFSERLSEDIYAFTRIRAIYYTQNGMTEFQIEDRSFDSNLYYFYLLALDDGGKSRKSKRKSRKSKRKSRKSKRKSKRKSRKSKRKSRKSSGRCEKSNLKKYITRPGPQYPAQNCKYSIRTGNDGNMYRSIPNKNGVFSWKKL